MTKGRNIGNGGGSGSWQLTKDKVLLSSGLSMIGATWIATVVFSRPFHYEFLLAGLALCGIGIAQLGDKK